MRISVGSLWVRASFVLGFLLVAIAARRPLCGIEGMGEFELETFSEWGGSMIRWLAWAGVCACLLLPAGLVRLLAGALTGGVAMLALTLGRDALELAGMDAEMSASMELVKWTGSGLMFGLGVMLLLLVGLVSAIPLKSKIPGDRKADGNLKRA